MAKNGNNLPEKTCRKIGTALGKIRLYGQIFDFLIFCQTMAIFRREKRQKMIFFAQKWPFFDKKNKK